VIAAKAVAFHEATRPRFKDYAAQIIANAQALAEALMDRGWRLVSGGTDNHLMLVDLRSQNEDLTGHQAAQWLAEAGLIANKNAIPFDPRPPVSTSGLRLGTPALTTRCMGAEEMRLIGGWIDEVLSSEGNKTVIMRILDGVRQLCRRFPIPKYNRF